MEVAACSNTFGTAGLTSSKTRFLAGEGFRATLGHESTETVNETILPELITVNEASLLVHYLTVGALLVGIGMAGFLARRNIILMFLSLEMMLQGVALSAAAWSRFHNDFGGQILVLFTIAVAAGEAAIALALIIVLFRESGTLDVLQWVGLREPDLPPPQPESPPQDISAELRPQPIWPRLAPAGRKPTTSPEAEEYRPRL